MSCVAPAGVYAPHDRYYEIECLKSILVGVSAAVQSVDLTIAKQINQSSHHRFRVNFDREYIRETTKAREITSRDQVKP